MILSSSFTQLMPSDCLIGHSSGMPSPLLSTAKSPFFRIAGWVAGAVAVSSALALVRKQHTVIKRQRSLVFISISMEHEKLRQTEVVIDLLSAGSGQVRSDYRI